MLRAECERERQVGVTPVLSHASCTRRRIRGTQEHAGAKRAARWPLKPRSSLAAEPRQARLQRALGNSLPISALTTSPAHEHTGVEEAGGCTKS
jgi:hypothetical protein